ncbi:putative iSBma2, transposase [Burkholderia mallei]|nr:putative iSBma2, transposase [Burkholderia mallei]
MGYARWPSSACWPRRHRNIKKIAMLLARKRKKGPAGPDWRFVRMLLRLVSGLRCSFDYPLAANPQS